MRKRIAILGSTGSIGVNTLDVVSKLKDNFEIVGLSADTNINLLSRQAARFKPKIVSIGSLLGASKMRGIVPSGTRIVCGEEGLKEIASRPDVDIAVLAISGSKCLIPLMTAIENKKRIALANKESLVSAGSIVMKAAKKKGVALIPVDSEHSAIFQCIAGKADPVSKIYLTGSGGPLLNVPRSKFDCLPRKFILNHPRWKMGRKITVDSATMMNKGLEIIEAMRLFDIDEKIIEVLIHPEAIIHSMVEFRDASVLAQMAVPDMRLPIQYALTYPERLGAVTKRVDFSKVGSLTFREPDLGKFPCLRLAREAARAGGLAPAVLNASDEAAVESFLEGDIGFTDIPRIIEKVLSKQKKLSDNRIGIDEVIEADRWAREEARSICSQ